MRLGYTTRVTFLPSSPVQGVEGDEATHLGALVGAGPAPFAEVDAGEDTGTLRLGASSDSVSKLRVIALGGRAVMAPAAVPPGASNVRVKGMASVPKNWRSASAAAPAPSAGRTGSPDTAA